eukprot:TRINITY_DN6309_c0_g1_i1.p1 TRINITY_DN6309_c0_g1~~TRINITY_DN6309_c0_g1_i1.p1  ORF type:complete len:425 (+),score=91.63 TRINITY_DN6309_c0_g1_i1:52-1275(+)
MDPIVARFLEYTKINTTSNPRNISTEGPLPTSDGQRVLAEYVAKELQALGVATTYENGILYGKVAGSCEGGKTVGFAPHLDTAPDYNTDTKAVVIKYNGGDVVLADGKSVINESDIGGYKGQDVIVTSGDSLLGGDDKAAIAAVVTAIEEIVRDGTPHGEIQLAFLPDEEIGLLGAKQINKTHFNPSFAYCMDCCGIGEYVTKTWSAAQARITVKGTPAHPMSCKGNLVNPITVAYDEVISKIPLNERPENTEGEEGFMYVKGLQGDGQAVEIDIFLRYFDQALMERRKADLARYVAAINDAYPLPSSDRATLAISDTYADPSALISRHPHVTRLILDAMESLSITPRPIAMRGGYDGCALAAHGIPAANFFTGAHNFHSNTEFLPVPSLVAAKDMVKLIIAAASTL